MLAEAICSAFLASFPAVLKKAMWMTRSSTARADPITPRSSYLSEVPSPTDSYRVSPHSGARPRNSRAAASSRPKDELYKVNAVRLGRMIDIKNMVEYEERLVFRKEADKAIKDCERFLAFVKSEIPLEDNS